MPDTFGACAYEREYRRLSAIDEVFKEIAAEPRKADRQLASISRQLATIMDKLEARADAKTLLPVRRHVNMAWTWLRWEMEERE